MCAGKVMGPGGEAIKSLSERTGCSVVVEGKSPNAAFVPFRLVNYLAPGAAQISAAVAEVVELVCQEEKYEAGECSNRQQGPPAPSGKRSSRFRRRSADDGACSQGCPLAHCSLLIAHCSFIACGRLALVLLPALQRLPLAPPPHIPPAPQASAS